jgi:hypothetical protein
LGNRKRILRSIRCEFSRPRAELVRISILGKFPIAVGVATRLLQNYLSATVKQQEKL